MDIVKGMAKKHVTKNVNENKNTKNGDIRRTLERLDSEDLVIRKLWLAGCDLILLYGLCKLSG